jgi:hypothetical protein
MKYNYTRHEWEVELNDVLEETPYTESDLVDELDEPEKFLIQYSRTIYRVIYRTNRNKKALHYKIYLNKNDEKNLIKEAILEYLKGAMTTGMDTNVYTSKGENDIPHSVYEILGQELLYQGYFPEEYIEVDYGDTTY